ncbi:hypothetical protein OIU77_000651 [Salix suchowensis]|uniref:Minichromosome loss protein Mcl1 middle region domain-containing protein n=1 Tax=Salix suchowensis TaxID=1278906 RepID=A0ABQ9B6U8_9ROSI|nr:hypothetical protein OIU77_000651 [Salix suchowensis]
MKVRSLKLREAHKSINGNNDNNPSLCSVLWDQQAHHLVTASSSDPSISIHDPLIPSNPPKILRHHRDGVTALALSPNSTCLASGSIDHSVKLYKFPSGEFETNVTRFTLPIRALAFNKSGSMVAAAGDDEGIKLINTIDGSIARVLKGHKGPVTGLAFDPINEYLATVDSVGTVLFWELQSGGILHTLKSVAPNNISDTSFMNVVSWSPDGETLAVPGLRNDVVMYDRDTAEKLFSLRGDHVQPVCYLSWSPNGKYMATSGLDRQILIWDVDKKQDIDRQKFEDRISGMAWKPIGNVLAVIDVMGKYGLWELVVPSSMKSPTEDIPSLKNSNGVLLFDEEDPEPSTSGGLSEFAEDILCESEPSCRKRLRKQSESEDPDEDIDDELNLLPKTETRKKVHRASKDNLDKGNGLRNTVTPAWLKMQEAFQPGATPPQRGKRRFLCYNMLGTITTVENDGYSHIEIDFHDTGRGPRLPSMTDYFGFTMASLNENGSVFANPCKGEKNMSTLMYRPFSSWANNSEWSMRFEGEEVKVVALGNAWVAAITSLNFLRIYTDGGLQRHIISLDGPVATASGFKNQLAVVTHVSDCLPSIDQMLEFRVFDISSGTQALTGRLPLTPGSHLIWFGFSEEGQLSSYDSKGVLRVFTSQYGGSWLPVFSASKEKKSDESYWVVGLNASKLFCISYKSPDKFPQVIPKPVLSLLNLSFPVASSDLGADALENEFILNSMHLSQIQKRMEDMAGACLDTTALDDEAFNMEATQDRCILRLIASCCNGDKLVRATELMKLLSLEKSMKGAIKLVTALKLPNLAERFNTILEERLVNESKGTHKSPLLSFNGHASLTADDAAISKMMVTSNGKNEKPESSIGFSSPTLSAPLFIKKENKQEHEKSDQNQTTNAKTSMEPSYAEKVKSAENVLRVGDVKMTGQVLKVQSQRLSYPSLKSSNNQETTKKDPDQLAAPLRPSNPFKKAPN